MSSLVPDTEIKIIPAPSLLTLPLWPALHDTIETSYYDQQPRAFPPTWKRLHPNTERAAQKLVAELGPHGHLAILFANDSPIACGGMVPFSGEKWIKFGGKAVRQDTAEPPATTTEFEQSFDRPSKTYPVEDSGHTDTWEICCFCVRPEYRHKGVSGMLLSAITDFVLSRGATKLVSGYILEETGDYWPRLGFETIEGAGGTLRAGFKHKPDMEPVREDLHFATGVKALR